MSDLISRRQAIDALECQIKQCNKALSNFGISMIDEYAVKVERASLVAYEEQLKCLPSVQPTAAWLIHKWGDDAQCSNCGRSFKDVYDMENYDQYCRHCGTHMKGVTTT